MPDNLLDLINLGGGGGDNYAAEYYSNILGKQGRTQSPLSLLPKIVAGFMLGKEIKRMREQKGAAKVDAFSKVKAITDNKDFTNQQKATELMKLKPDLVATYGKDFGDFVDDITKDFLKQAEIKTTKEATELTTATSLRKEFATQPHVKDFMVITGGYHKMRAAFDRLQQDPTNMASKNAVDQAIVIVFNKILDPGSVVRESEFARTPEGIPMIKRMEALWDKVRMGGVGLTDDEREEIVNTAGVLLNAAGKDYNLQVERYSELSRQYKVRPELVVGKPFEPIEVENEGQVSTTPTVDFQNAINAVDVISQSKNLKKGDIIPGLEGYVLWEFDKDGMPIAVTIDEYNQLRGQ